MNTLDYDYLYINGEWSAPSTPERIDVIGAATGKRVGSVASSAHREVDYAVESAQRAFNDPEGWAAWSPTRRAAGLDALATALEAHASDIAYSVTVQNGMPISLARQLETGMPVATLRYFAGLIREQGDDNRRGYLGGDVRVLRQPIGVVAAIVPWNFPQTLAFTKLAPALAAGCTVVLKPSPETVLDSMVLARAIAESGLPPGVVNIVPGGRSVGEHLVAHPGVDKVAFTGSTDTGRAIASVCGQLLRPVSLELGGRSAAIVLDDANMADHLESFFGAALLNNGQCCYATTRVLAPQSRYDEIVEQLTSFVSTLTVGDPLSPDTQVGPLTTARQRDRFESYLSMGIADGGKLTTGGSRPADLPEGWFVTPAVMADVNNSSRIAQEEVFGPVVTITSYSDENEAVRLANESNYGLGGTVWTADLDRGLAVARRVRTGTIGINGYIPDPAIPFGGVKDSGASREFGPEGLAAYTHLQSVHL
ncbi:aldehyde dehydrogenase [Nocardia testacea]|uniref:aldehyde dehydrogenase n=1 Tax=Nocardia testacea TaxID=248551 RepID=UPI003A85D496